MSRFSYVFILEVKNGEKWEQFVEKVGVGFDKWFCLVMIGIGSRVTIRIFFFLGYNVWLRMVVVGVFQV